MATPQSTVTYKLIPDHPGYRVGDDGSVWSCRKRVGVPGKRVCDFIVTDEWHRLTPAKTPGRLFVKLEGGRTFGVHRLVLLAFVGPCPEGMEGCHNDGNPHNNALSNLRWDSDKANQADRERHGRTARGVRNGKSVLGDERVRYARARFAAGGITRAQLARELGITWNNLNAILNRETWKHVE